MKHGSGSIMFCKCLSSAKTVKLVKRLERTKHMTILEEKNNLKLLRLVLAAPFRGRHSILTNIIYITLFVAVIANKYCSTNLLTKVGVGGMNRVKIPVKIILISGCIFITFQNVMTVKEINSYVRHCTLDCSTSSSNNDQ